MVKWRLTFCGRGSGIFTLETDKSRIKQTEEVKKMLGAIFGDIVGSVYEFNNTKREDFPLLSKWSHPSDDSMMTLAVARALMNTWGRSDDEIRAELVRSMQQIGRRYPNAGYGGSFARWLRDKNPRPYNSFGNGSARRVSSVGWL